MTLPSPPPFRFSPSERLGTLLRSGKRLRDRGESHTRLVRRMRLALPLAAFALIAVLVAWPQMENPSLPGSDGVPAHTNRNEVIAPRFESRDDDRQPYTVTAASAVQDSADRDLVRLEKPVADMTLNTGKWLAAQAASGLFSQSRRRLVLDGRVRIHHDDGYELTVEKVEIDLKNRTAHSSAPVYGHGPAGTVEARGFDAETDGGRIVFIGPARLVLNRALPGL